MDRLDAMRVFVSAVDEGSFAAAARALQRSPAAISRAIAALERHLGAPLVHRTTRVMRLTDFGQQYVAVCRLVLDEIEAVEGLAAEGLNAPRGVLTISAPPISGEEVLRPIVDDFLRAQPLVSVRLLLSDRHVGLVEEAVDVALRVGDLPASSLQAVKVGTDVRRVLVAAPSYLDARPALESPADLAHHDIIAMSHFGEDRWVFPPLPQSPAPRTVTFRPRVLVTSVRAAAASAAAGLGVSRLYSYHVASYVRRGDLRIVLAGDEPAPMPVHLVLRPGRAQTPKVRAFLDFAVPRLRSAFSQLATEAHSLHGEQPVA